MLTDGDRAVLCARVTAALERHETGHSAHGLRIAFMAGSAVTSLLLGKHPGGASVTRVLVALVADAPLERERAAARTLLAIINYEADANARLAKLEAP